MPLDHLEDHIRRTDSNIPSNTDVFETFWVTDNGNVFMLDEHLERMKKSVGELELGETPDIERLSDEIREMTQKKEFHNRVLRLEYSANTNGSANYSIHVRETESGMDPNLPIRLLLSEGRRNPKSFTVSHKTGNYLENRIARRKAKKCGYDDALFLNTDGYLAETTVSNIFLVRDHTLITPSAESGILPGIVRSWVLDYAIRSGIVALCISCDLDELREADEVFVTNSVIGIRPVSEIADGEMVLFSSSGCTDFTEHLQKAYQEAISHSNGRRKPEESDNEHNPHSLV